LEFVLLFVEALAARTAGYVAENDIATSWSFDRVPGGLPAPM
jgi:hypothetical protein